MTNEELLYVIRMQSRRIHKDHEEKKRLRNMLTHFKNIALEADRELKKLELEKNNG